MLHGGHRLKDALADQKRITEENLHESIDARTESLLSLRELGPPDLVHLLRQSIRNPLKQVGAHSHHYICVY